MILSKLASALAVSHQDVWLHEFLSSPRSEKGNHLLQVAIQLNHAGDADHALQAAIAAERAFRQVGNKAGALRSDFEQIYALRRRSRASECIQKGSLLRPALSAASYPWIEAQTAMELSSCEVMANNPDRSLALSEQAIATSAGAGYTNLHLRALSLRGNLEMHEGRREATWKTIESGLTNFWRAAYPHERGFQFYHDLEFDADTSGLSHLALLLQCETLSMITGHGRFDFEAMAHFRMAEAAERLGNVEEARKELNTYRSVIDRLPLSSDARSLYEAYCEIGFARLALRAESPADASTHLGKALPWVAKADNASLRLEYLQAHSAYEQTILDAATEEQDLRSISALVLQEFQHTVSASDRWHLRRALDDAQRRLLELRITQPHEPIQTFAEWHWSRGLENTASVFPLLVSSPEAWAQEHLHHLGPGALVSFAVLPHAVVAWIASNQGVREQVLPLEAASLKKEVRLFYQLCSDPHSELQKVNASGSRLYEMLIAPLHLDPRSGHEIYIATDSFLSFVPWAALRTPDGQYWGFMQDIILHTGFGAGNGQHPGHLRLGHVLVALPGATSLDGQKFLPLPHAEEEARYVSKVFPDARVLGSGKVTASRLRSELKRADALHFAGHAISRESGGELILDPGQGPAFMSASDLQQIPLPHLKLVVLSACSTAKPGPDADQSPEGLVRAFIGAGVPVVIASRWDVDSSSTTQLMLSFYKFVRLGDGPTQALRHADQGLAEFGHYHHPYYWSSFQVFADN